MSAFRPARRLSAISGFCLAVACSGLQPAVAADARLEAPFDGPGRWPRVSPVDFLHLRVEVTPDWTSEAIEASATHRIRARRPGVRTLGLDAVGIDVRRIRDGEGRELAHRSSQDRLEIDLASPLEGDVEVEVTIEYRARPRRGVYFIQALDGYPDRPRQVWTQGEAEYARHWIPCFDSPSERLTTELLVTVPNSMRVLSNGERAGDEDRGDSTHTVHWRQDQPHVTYLICFAAGEYELLTDTWDGIPLAFWHYPGDRERAELSFSGTADMMEYFSGCFGRYPWPKYDQIVIRDFVAGGMENTSATFLTDHTLHRPRDELHDSSRSLVAHELAHQWFGDLVTCRDWADLWLNESFATFCSPLYTEHALGRPDAQMERREQVASYLGEARRYRRPISCRTYRSPDAMFDRHSYPKGGRVLEMLRQHLGDDLFFGAVRHYLERHRGTSVESYQLRRAMEDFTGESLGWFFEQWIHRPGHPSVRVTHEFDPGLRLLTLRVEQGKADEAPAAPFRLPVEVGIHDDSDGLRIERVIVKEEQESFTFSVERRPAFVRFDQRSVLLMELEHSKSRSEWIAQLTGDPDTIGRIRAAEALGRRVAEQDDGLARVALERRLRSEPFWGVRRAVARALGGGGGDPSARALERALARDSDPRVREVAASGLGRLARPGSASVLRLAVERDASDWVRTEALRSLLRIDAGSARDLARGLVKEAADSGSLHERLVSVALDALRANDEGKAVSAISALARPGVRRALRLAAIRTLGRLGRERPEVVPTLAGQVDDPLPRTRRTLYEALGRSGGPIARRALRDRRDREPRPELRDAIDRALGAIGRRGGDERLARELEELRRTAADLKRRVRALEDDRKG